MRLDRLAADRQGRLETARQHQFRGLVIERVRLLVEIGVHERIMRRQDRRGDRALRPGPTDEGGDQRPELVNWAAVRAAEVPRPVAANGELAGIAWARSRRS